MRHAERLPHHDPDNTQQANAGNDSGTGNLPSGAIPGVACGQRHARGLPGRRGGTPARLGFQLKCTATKNP